MHMRAQHGVDGISAVAEILHKRNAELVAATAADGGSLQSRAMRRN
jgi:hypothetical protein